MIQKTPILFAISGTFLDHQKNHVFWHFFGHFWPKSEDHFFVTFFEQISEKSGQKMDLFLTNMKCSGLLRSTKRPKPGYTKFLKK